MMTTTATGVQVGRLADPGMDPGHDPRLDPRLLAALLPYGLETAAPSAPLDRSAPQEDRDAYIREAEAGVEGLYEALPDDLPTDAGAPVLEHVTEVIPGPGGPISLRISRPAGTAGPLPSTVYIHGGGMTILSATSRVHRRWAEDLAASGMVVVAVDFRNAAGAAGTNPFPAGLDDCATAVAWIHAHRHDLGIATLVLQGESGGANLALATTLRAKREGTLAAIDGVYAMVPYISGAYGWDEARKLAELPSLVENDGYFLECGMMDVLVAAYDPTGDHAEDPLAWPYFASRADLEGLPPHVISVNELDPLRDEGIAYYRRLLAAGVEATGRVNLGITHGADTLFRQALAAVRTATVADIHRFAAGL